MSNRFIHFDFEKRKFGKRGYMERTAGELAKYLGAELEGNPDLRVRGCASVATAKAGNLVFVDSPKQLEAAAK